MPKVLISDKMSPAATEIFRARGVEVDEKTGMSPTELIACIADYDGLALRSSTKATAEVVAAAHRLKVIGRAGIGVDNVDIPAATARGIVVMNTPFGNSITTAEHTIAMLLAAARQVAAANVSTHAGKWEKSRFMGVEVYGKTLGLIGAGNIGSIVADRAQGLKMKVIGYDPYLTVERAADLAVEKVELDDLFARADFITLHTPLTDATRGIIDAEAFTKMKQGVYIVNCARGGLVVEADLRDALESGKVAGAAVDVFSEEPAKDNVLFGAERLVVTPHLGASTSEAQEKVAIQVAEQMADFLTVGAVTNALNMPSVSAEDAPKLRPYMTLARQVGGFLGQIAESGITRVRIDYAGQIASLNTRPLTAIVLEGLLSPTLDSVNMVNAPVVAKERNIEVTESHTETIADYQSLVHLTVTGEAGEQSLAGTLYADKYPRLVRFNGIEVEAEIAAEMLLVTNEDKPGFIGRLGMALGEAGVNIATFNLGRMGPGGEALALVSVDEPISDAVLMAIRALPLVRSARALHFT